ncbi:MAG: hypothetical protein CVT94_09415 [Bacteroidetes bacterium HGW-Bacteroidetes-11]|jgi:hypothetical protein|nr:MAG: hypothetical protein CVT94_09415 [Bacteroidetes bacterium HGW-Bacteroidetes-11]
MSDYCIPDIRWNIVYQIKSCQAYEDRFVVKGNFHSLVPDDIIKEFEIAERLMAYSYYCYPMYDEALKKLLGMTEMAVKLRCTQFDISLEFQDRNGKVKQRTLSELMDQLLIIEPNKPLKSEFSKARKARNIFAHPDHHSIYGVMIFDSILQLINTINYIFLEDQICKESNAYFDELCQSYRSFGNGDLILEYNGMRYLAYGSKCLEVHPISGEWISLWVFYPEITNIREQVETQNYSMPLYLALKDVKIEDNCLIGTDIESNKAIKFLSTNEPKDLERIATFRKQLNECEQTSKTFYLDWLNSEMGKKLVHHRYKYYW